MNETYINYIDQLLDLAERNDIFCLTSRAFNEFAVEVREVLEKQRPMKPVPLKYEPLILHGWEYGCPACEKAVGFNKYAVEYTDEDPFCPSCGQKLDWED